MDISDYVVLVAMDYPPVNVQNRPFRDQAITESMEAITDHGFEHLALSHGMIT